MMTSENEIYNNEFSNNYQDDTGEKVKWSSRLPQKTFNTNHNSPQRAIIMYSRGDNTRYINPVSTTSCHSRRVADDNNTDTSDHKVWHPMNTDSDRLTTFATIVSSSNVPCGLSLQTRANHAVLSMDNCVINKNKKVRYPVSCSVSCEDTQIKSLNQEACCGLDSHQRGFIRSDHQRLKHFRHSQPKEQTPQHDNESLKASLRHTISSIKRLNRITANTSTQTARRKGSATTSMAKENEDLSSSDASCLQSPALRFHIHSAAQSAWLVPWQKLLFMVVALVSLLLPPVVPAEQIFRVDPLGK